MSFEDQPEKLRRNVVVGSFAIILIGLLKLELPPNVMGISLPPESHHRVWVIISVAFAYVFLRYWHTDEAVKARAKLALERSSLQSREERQLLQTSLILFERFKWGPWLDFEKFKKGFEELLPNSSWDDANGFRIDQYKHRSGNVDKNFIGIGLHYKVTDERYERTRVDFRQNWPLSLRLVAGVSALFHVLFNTKYIVDFYVPYLLTIGAVATLAFRLSSPAL